MEQIANVCNKGQLEKGDGYLLLKGNSVGVFLNFYLMLLNYQFGLQITTSIFTYITVTPLC